MYNIIPNLGQIGYFKLLMERDAFIPKSAIPYIPLCFSGTSYIQVYLCSLEVYFFLWTQNLVEKTGRWILDDFLKEGEYNFLRTNKNNMQRAMFSTFLVY